MISKIHINNHRVLVSLCDDDILGSVFEEGEFILDLSSGFYKGEKRDNDELIEVIKKSYMINAVGEKSSAFLIENGFIRKENLSYIKKIPFIQLIFD